MIMGNEIRPYVLKGEITPKWTLRAILSDQEKFNPNATQAEIDFLVTNLFSEDDAKKMLGRALDDINEEDTISWTRDHAVTIAPGYFYFANHLDFEEGVLWGDIRSDFVSHEFLFMEEEDRLSSYYPNASFSVHFSGISFALESIEMLQPSVDAHSFGASSVPKKSALGGRPPKWDWESALEHIIALAQSADGLPIGPGAQAAIERIISTWFIERDGDAPTESLIRTRAQRIMRSLGGRKIGF